MTTPFALLFFRPAAWAAASEDVQKNFRTVSFFTSYIIAIIIANRIEEGINKPTTLTTLTCLLHMLLLFFARIC